MPPKTQSVLLGAALYTVLSLITGFIALNSGQVGQSLTGLLCCLVAIGSPMLAVWHYTNEYNLTIPAGPGAAMGALVVVIGGAISYGIQRILQATGAFPTDEEIMERTRDQLASQGMDAEQIEQIMGFAEMSSGITGFLVNLVVAVVIGVVGGVLGAVIFKKGGTAEEFEGGDLA